MGGVAPCGCPTVYPLPDYVKVGGVVVCHHEHDLVLDEPLRRDLALMADVPVDQFKVTVTKGIFAKVTALDDHYVKVEFETPDQAYKGPWFNEMLRGDFAWYWCGTAEDALSRMMGFPNVDNPPV